MTDRYVDPLHDLFEVLDAPAPLDDSFRAELLSQLESALAAPVRFTDTGHAQLIELKPPVPRRSHWPRLAAVAVVLLLVGVSLMFSARGNGDDNTITTNVATTSAAPSTLLRRACDTFNRETALHGTNLADLANALSDGTVGIADIVVHLDDIAAALGTFRTELQEISIDDHPSEVQTVLAEFDRIDATIHQVVDLPAPIDLDDAARILTRLSWAVLAANQPLAGLGAGGCLS